MRLPAGLLLASRSETRRQMLEAAGITFESVDAGFDEEAAKGSLIAAGAAPRDLAGRLAAAKARSVAAPSHALVLGADQVLEREDGSMLGKPASRAEARDQLRSLSGRTHYLHSAAAIVEDGAQVWDGTETVALRVRPLSDAFLETYLDREYETVRWNVGGYRIEGPGVQLFEAIEGSHFAILGLPLLPLLAFLRDRGLLTR